MNISMVAFESWLESAANYEKQKKHGEFSLKTMALLANQLDNPQLDYDTIHVAGSKGKGSVSTMCSCILNMYGFSDGLYTSPHILDFLERISSSNGQFSKNLYEEAAAELVQFIENTSDELEKMNFSQASWFELITLFAFIVFKKAKVDCAVFETGLGGRLDATNILQPKVSIITPIELEHTEYLGDTISKIAFEKAGIIKMNTPVCSACQTAEAKKVIKKVSRKMHSPVYFLDETVKKIDCTFQNRQMNICIDFGDFKLSRKNPPLFSRPINTSMKLLGNIQAQNAALAALALKIAYPEITEEEIEKGLNNATLPGRFEIINYNYKSSKVTIILDGAHTPNSIGLSIDTYNALFKDLRCSLLFACAYDKHIENIAPLFFDKMNTKPVSFCCTKPGENKPSDLVRLANAVEPLCKKHDVPYLLNEDYITAIDFALEKAAQADGILFVTGSFYLVAECKKHLLFAKANC